MEHTVLDSFGCESFEALAWHLASCHWGLGVVPKGLIEELKWIDKLDLAELQRLRYKYTESISSG